MMDVGNIDSAADTQRIKDLHDDQISDSNGSDMFQKLLLTELQYQDPLNPVENKEMVTQLAQLNSLQELQNLNNNILELFKSDHIGDAASLIGKTIYGHEKDSHELLSGVVDSVNLESGEVYLNIGTKQIKFDDLIRVSPGVTNDESSSQTNDETI